MVAAANMVEVAALVGDTARSTMLGALMGGRGRLIVASQTAPGSVAAAHLNFMLTCQAGGAALPRPGELEADLSSAGFELTDVAFIVPTEPFLAITATRR